MKLATLPAGAALLLALTHPAYAQPRDTWTNVRPGVDYLHRVVASGPQDIFAARINLRQAGVSLHMSANNVRERRVTTPTFARNVGALIAINGDWSDGNTPVGLAIADGTLWHNHIRDSTLGGRWGYFGCTLGRACSIGAPRPLDVDSDLLAPTLQPHRFFQAIGGNGILLMVDGRAQSGCYDTARNPRSAVGLSPDGNTAWFVVIDGRRAAAGAAGMTCNETRALMLDLGCHNAAMLDGGGSSTLVVDGTVRNTPSDGSPRVVSNHIGLIYTTTADARCRVPDGRWCTGTQLATCSGGRYLGGGDCAAFGATCEAEGSYGYCVDARCPGHAGNRSACLDARRIASCNDGQYTTGDCGAFGLGCAPDGASARCMDARCAAYDSVGCAGDVQRRCVQGVYTETRCADTGTTCDAARGCIARTPIDAGVPTVDVTAPTVDVTAPSADVTAPTADVTTADVTTPTADVTTRDAPPISVDAPAVVDITLPDVTSPDAGEREPTAQSGCACSVGRTDHGAAGGFALVAGLLALGRSRRRYRQRRAG